MSSEKPIIILGAGGHASVVADVLRKLNKTILGFVAPEKPISAHKEIDYIGTDLHFLSRFSPQEVLLVNGIGSISVEKNQNRQKVYFRFKEKGYEFITLVHPSACIAQNAVLKEGCQVMAGAIIQPNVIVEENAIINTKASIDHDCKVGNSVHIAPGVTLSGNVFVEENAFVGVGATVIQGITIGSHAMVFAGRTVVKNVAPLANCKE